MKTSEITNRWGRVVRLGDIIQAHGASDIKGGRVVSFDCSSRFARAYGVQVRLDTGISVGADDIFEVCRPEPFPRVSLPTMLHGEILTAPVATPANGPTGLSMARSSMRRDAWDACIMRSFTGRFDCTYDDPRDRMRALAFRGLPFTMWEV